MLKVEFRTTVDVPNELTQKEGYIRLDMDLFSRGVVAQMRPTSFTVLMAILSFMDEKGECSPPQSEIALRAGVSRATVNKAITELTNVKVDGKPLIGRKIIQTSIGTASQYTVAPEVITDTSTNGETKTEETAKGDGTIKFANAKVVADYYMKKYHQQYGTFPSINYGRDLKVVKDKWIGKYTDADIKAMVDTAIEEYDRRWKTPKFQRPTLSAIASWIGEQALGLKINQEKEYKEVMELTGDSEEMNNNALNRLQKRLQK